MKPALIVLIILLQAPLRSESFDTCLLRAICVVESADRTDAVGAAGERGLYQFRLGTWRQHTSSSFELAFDREFSTTVAHQHLNWIRRTLLALGIEPTARSIAITWNAGVGNVRRGTIPAYSREYAERVTALLPVESDAR